MDQEIAAAESAIVAAARTAGRSFEDTSFTPERSLGEKISPSDVKFSRPRHDSMWRPRLLQASLSPGALADSWFIAAVGLIAATRADLLDGLFAVSRPTLGGHAIRIFADGAWRLVTVDDRVPAGFARVIGGQNPDSHSWVSLIEKAFAKRHGSYSAISCPGLVSEALCDLTGTPVLTLVTKGSHARPVGELWTAVKSHMIRGAVVGALRNEQAGDAQGIANGVAYAVLSVEELPEPLGKVCILRAMLGSPVWAGKFSRQSPEFASLPAALGTLLEASPGTELVSFEDVVSKFSEIYIVEAPRIGSPPLRSFTARGEWRGESAGGCAGNPSFPRNPQFGLSVPSGGQACRVLVSLSQPDSTPARNAYKSLGFIVAKSSDKSSRKSGVFQGELVATSGPFINKRDVTAEIELQPGQNYVIIVSTYEPGKEGLFILRVMSSEVVELRQLVDHAKQEAPKPMTVFRCSRCGKDVAEAYGNPHTSAALMCRECLDLGKKCARCGGPILGDTVCKSFGTLSFHVDCFRCSGCNSSLSKLSPVAGADGKLLCSACSRACSACGKPIGSQAALQLSEKLYHKGCLVCTSCHAEIGESFVSIIGEKFFCEPCSKKK